MLCAFLLKVPDQWAQPVLWTSLVLGILVTVRLMQQNFKMHSAVEDCLEGRKNTN
jgi:hypothetical protein